MNANFAVLAAAALNRTAGTVTGALTSSGGSLAGSWAGSPTITGGWTFSGVPVFSGAASFTSTPVFSGAGTVTGSFLFDSDALRVYDTNASHALILTPGSDLTANRIFTLTTGDAARTLTMTGDATVNQDVSSTGAPTFATVNTGQGANELYGMDQAVLTSSSPQFTAIEVGNASDTTLTRASAGVLAVEGSNLAKASNNLSVFAATTSAQLAGVLSDETGSGAAVFGTSPTLVTPTIGTIQGTLANTGEIALGGTLLASASGALSTSASSLTVPSGGQFIISSGYNGGNRGIQMEFPATGNVEGLGVRFNNIAPNDTSHYFFFAQDSGTQRFSVRSNGGIANFSANDVNLSDERRKNIHGRLGSHWNRWRALDFVYYAYKDAPGIRHAGLTAQRTQKVYPELVTEFEAGSLGIRESELFMVMGRVVQELQRRVEQLEAQLGKQ